ncbi:hypothetical protein X943_002580 [Babesia divergens]|uniref:Uncharacterized protein n=1 Tax=Babesia divergens TaxID=32595 RepID=A0AAD9LF14_BABDI|nr:hypothetical protein X943_002580 [Babesia divergens]
MTRIPPGISRRKVYSETLENTGSLIEERYKEHQLEDLPQLRQQANQYITRSMTNKIVKTYQMQSAKGEEIPFSNSIDTLSDAIDHPADCALDSVGNSPRNSETVDTLEREDKTPLGFQRLQTKVVLDISGAGTNHENTGEHTLQSTSNECEAVVRSRLTDFSIDANSDGNVCLTMHAMHAKEDPALPDKRKTIGSIGRWCLAVEAIISVALIAILLVLVIWDWGHHLRTFTILYPFVVYFTLRIVVVFFDCLLSRYIRAHNLSTPARSHSATGCSRTHTIKELFNNICIILAVAAAVLPYGSEFGTMTVQQVNGIYFALIVLIYTIRIVATYLHLRKIYSYIKPH